MHMKKIFLLCFLLLAGLTASACGNDKEAAKPVLKPATAVFETSLGNFECTLATDLAPETCKNFITLAQ